MRGVNHLEKKIRELLIHPVERSKDGSENRRYIDSGDGRGAQDKGRMETVFGQIQWKMCINYEVSNSVPCSQGHVGRKGNHGVLSVPLS